MNKIQKMNVHKIELKDEIDCDICPNEMREGEAVRGHTINLTAESPLRQVRLNSPTNNR